MDDVDVNIDAYGVRLHLQYCLSMSLAIYIGLYLRVCAYVYDLVPGSSRTHTLK
jgi:hypothetical protein